MLFFSPPPPPPLSSLPSWSPLPCCLIGRETLGKIAGISFHRSPRLSTRVMSCLFGIMHSRRSRSPQTPHLPPTPPRRISRSAAEICAFESTLSRKHPARACSRARIQQPAARARSHAQTHETNSHMQLRCRSPKEEERGVWSF